ncbi:MAG: hypothetical protein F6J93_03725 [Oscillatoria sp. SIO1A7]|nr:hypothetical protein [Oscillatoria sp. SIO1A7]
MNQTTQLQDGTIVSTAVLVGTMFTLKGFINEPIGLKTLPTLMALKKLYDGEFLSDVDLEVLKELGLGTGGNGNVHTDVVAIYRDRME